MDDKKQLKVLILEDNSLDMEVIKKVIQQNIKLQLEFKWVIYENDFIDALNSFHPDIILSDYSLPSFNGLDALKHAIKINPFVPFIIVTGAMSEEVAADSIKAGAWDYVVKNRIHRLPSVFMNALKLKDETEKSRKTEDELKHLKIKTDIQLKMLYNAVENAPSSIVITGKDGLIEYVNPEFEKCTGYSMKEVIGKNPKIVKSGIHNESLYKDLWDTINNGHQWRGELVNKKKNGEIFWEQVSISPIMDENDKIQNFIAVKQDITDRKNSERIIRESEIKLKTILDETQAGIVILDEASKEIIDLNPAAIKLFGLQKEEIIGRSNLDFICKAPGCPNCFEKEDIKNAECTITTSSGTVIPIIITISKVELNERKCLIESFVDISEQKELQQNLKRALIKAEESDSLKSAFLATMSHELRTPLNTVIGFSELITEGLEITDAIEMAKRINKNGNDLLKIIESIFELSMIQSKVTKLQIEKIDLYDIFASLKQIIKARLIKENKMGLESFYKPDPDFRKAEINTDRKKLLQILGIFADNAVKFTEQGKIEYGFNLRDTNIDFFVSDTGIGIPNEKHQAIFDKFRQVDDSHTRKYSGIGMGLAICKELAPLLNGELRLESEVGMGSTFYFSLPYTESSDQEVKPKTRNTITIDLSGKTILIAEDFEPNYIFLKRLLASTNANTIWVQNGIDAVRAVRKNAEIDLILMDILMPGLNGHQATRQIKALRPELIVIAQTAYAMIGDREQAFEHGCDDYITKPFRKHELLKIIAKHLKIQPD